MSFDEPLDAELLEALEKLAATPRLLVALDFDGTIAPTVDVPDDARSLPAARTAGLALAAEEGVTVALVSGRAIDSLQRVTDAPPGVLFSGSHGAEYLVDGILSRPELTGEARDTLATLRTILEGVSARTPGAFVEAKEFGFALHTRTTLPHHASKANDLALAETRTLDGVTVREGKDVLEFSVLAATKADAINHLRDITGAGAVLFAGDDVTDEDGFGTLTETDVGIKVGPPPTRARFCVPTLEAMPSVLSALVGFRRRASRNP